MIYVLSGWFYVCKIGFQGIFVRFKRLLYIGWYNLSFQGRKRLRKAKNGLLWDVAGQMWYDVGVWIYVLRVKGWDDLSVDCVMERVVVWIGVGRCLGIAQRAYFRRFCFFFGLLVVVFCVFIPYRRFQAFLGIGWYNLSSLRGKWLKWLYISLKPYVWRCVCCCVFRCRLSPL